MMKRSELYHRTAQVIERDGWHQGDYYRDDRVSGPVCLAGAMNRVMGRCADEDVATVCNPALVRLMDLIPDDQWLPTLGVASWNDDPGRTVQEVLDLLRLGEKQALIEEERG